MYVWLVLCVHGSCVAYVECVARVHALTVWLRVHVLVLACVWLRVLLVCVHVRVHLGVSMCVCTSCVAAC